MSNAQARQVYASAGSGKTYTLTHEVVRLLGQGADFAEILAITFTNKAASEMKERVLGLLKDIALGQETNPETLAFWEHADANPKNVNSQEVNQVVARFLREYNKLGIRTIDSLLHGILHLFALSLGQSPKQEAEFAEQEVFKELLLRFAEKAWEEQGEAAALWRKAARENVFLNASKGFLPRGSLENTVKDLMRLLLEKAVARYPFAPEEALRHALSGNVVFFASVEDIHKKVLGIRQDVIHSAQALLACIAEEGLAVHASLMGALHKAAEKNAGMQSHSSSYFLRDELTLNKASAPPSKKAEGCFEALRKATERASMAEGPLIDALVVLPFLDIAMESLALLPEWEAEEDKALAFLVAPVVAQLVGNPNEISESPMAELVFRLGARFKHILLDEAQDTGSDQWLSLIPLVDEVLANGGSFLSVGDGKQAIYGWRGGDASLLPAVGARFGAESVILEQNWRSAPNVVAWNNQFFSRFADLNVARSWLENVCGNKACESVPEHIEAKAKEVAQTYSTSVQKAHPAKSGGCVSFAEQYGQNAEETRTLIVQNLVQHVQVLAGRYSLGDICILARTNGQLQMLAEALLAVGLPVITEGALALSASPMVRQLIDVLRFLENRQHDLAFAALLCGTAFPVGNTSDWTAQMRVEFLAKPRRTSLASAFFKECPALWEQYIAPLLRSVHGGASPYAALRATLHIWDIPRRFPNDMVFCLRLLEVAHKAEEAGCLDIPSFLEFWDAHGSEEKTPLPENAGAIRLMTLHKAKGLEFPVVLVPFFEGGRGQSELVPYEVEGLPVVCRNKAALGEMYYKKKVREAVEALNLVYVAFTRAKNELFFWLSGKLNKKGEQTLDAVSEALKNCLGALGLEPSAPEAWGAVYSAKDASTQNSAAAMPQALADSGEPPLLLPLAPLPRLRVRKGNFGQYLQEEALAPETQAEMQALAALQAKDRGLALHAKLETLGLLSENISPSMPIVADVEGMDRENRDDENIAWFLSTAQAASWLANGMPEVSFMGEDCKEYRLDLLVQEAEGWLVVDYKTGGKSATLPLPQHVAQVEKYRNLVATAFGVEKVRVGACLVYLDAHEICMV